MRRAPSQGAMSSKAASSGGGSPVRRPTALAASWTASPSAAAAPSSSALSSTERRRTPPRRAAALRVIASSSAVASPPPPAASSSSTMGGGGGGDLGEVTAIHGPEELDATLAANSDRLVVLMAKSAGCRPCKAFARKYQRISALYQDDAVFCVITGDESKETRAMMMAMKVRVTPTFFVYRDGALFKTTTGVNENNLKAALDEALGGGGGSAAAAGATTEEAAAA